jgi:hypothetical protein
MSNPFEAAIRFLTDLTKQPEPKNMCCTLHFTYRETDKDSFRAAIRLLEAAGKVDKEDKELAIHWMEDDYSTIRALLAALPEVKK